jgi:ubiquinone/menaquinone biosynthesis C-methylase UbiE
MTANFDSLSRPYRWLERIAFGGALERARFAHLDALSEARRVLLLGDGDGRFLEQLLRIAPEARVDSIDASAGMLRLAEARVTPADRARVSLQRADALTVPLRDAEYDTVVTLFFLDCFTPSETRALVQRVSSALEPRATWLFADFAIPEQGLQRFGARLVTGGLYWFFRWQTGITAQHLPDSEGEIAAAGFRATQAKSLAFGLLRSVMFRR